MANGYHVGEDVWIFGDFTNTDGDYIDPTNVFVKYRSPAGTVTPLQYGVDAALVKDAVGRYHVIVDATTPGKWWYRFYATGTGKAAKETYFEVAESAFS